MRLVKTLVVLVLLSVTIMAAGTLWMHLDIEKYRAPLPLVADILALDQAGDLPMKVSVIETAQQTMPRAGVLDPGSDPNPTAPYVMTHPSFVLEWADGRLLLIDVGMTRAGAIEFGQPTERFFGAGPIEPLTTAAVALGSAATRVQGMVFTHLHTDHVGGDNHFRAGAGVTPGNRGTAGSRTHDDRLTVNGGGLDVIKRDSNDTTGRGNAYTTHLIRRRRRHRHAQRSPVIRRPNGETSGFLVEQRDRRLDRRDIADRFRQLGLDRVILILRNRHCGQNTDNRDYDHQFDQRKAFLQTFH